MNDLQISLLSGLGRCHKCCYHPRCHRPEEIGACNRQQDFCSLHPNMQQRFYATRASRFLLAIVCAPTPTAINMLACLSLLNNVRNKESEAHVLQC